MTGDASLCHVAPASLLARIIPPAPTATATLPRMATSSIASIAPEPTNAGGAHVAPQSPVTSSRPPDATTPLPDGLKAADVNTVPS